MRQRFVLLAIILVGFLFPRAVAKDLPIGWTKIDPNNLPEGLESIYPCDSIEQVGYQPTNDKYRVVTNRFRHNWWVFFDAGIHTFRGDYSSYGKFGQTLSPNFSLGVGKWFTPGFGIKGSLGIGISRGFAEEYTPYVIGTQDAPYGYHDGVPFWKMKTHWWDGNLNAVFDISRILYAWEGYGVKERMNQFILTAGMGWVHHYGKDFNSFPFPYGGPKNEWYGNLELQWTHYFTKAKAWSLDVKLKGKFYETHFDLNTIKGNRWDYNAGINVGVTYYIKNRGWDRCLECEGANYYINIIAPNPPEGNNTDIAVQKCPTYKTITFYVFYPNNYSGRDDAPVVEGENVNSMDYLAGGIFTQRRFDDNQKVERNLASDASLRRLATENIPTETATFTSNPSGVVRGYEITDKPISLSMNPDSLSNFEKIMDYYYSPIYNGSRTWYYRVDEQTETQKLLSEENYKETKSFGLNSNKGLDIVRRELFNKLDKNGSDNEDKDIKLVSFADIYSALEGPTGYIYEHADSLTVAEIRKILTDGEIINVTAEGIATSQDNFTGEDAVNVGLTRNNTLSFNRALSPLLWLENNDLFKNVPKEEFVVNELRTRIGSVDDKSTRDINAKLNRCARVRISVLYNE